MQKGKPKDYPGRPGALGKVYLVGAGPGDPELLTLKAARLLREADVVLYDRLLSPKIIEGLTAELIDVGKSAGRHKMTQDEINRLLVEKGLAGGTIVRLKGGDPYVFGRGGEEALALKSAGIPFELVPGVTSAVAVPEMAGIPVTHRGVSTAFTVVTGHEEPGKDKNLDWSILAHLGGTLVVLMGVARLDENIAMLIAAGGDPLTPAAVIEKGGWPEQRTVKGTLGDIADLAKKAGVEPPAILVVGDVVCLEDMLGPRKIAIFRTANQMADSVKMAERYGFIAFPAPSIGISPSALPQDIIERVRAADCAVFTSSNGVEAAAKNPDLMKALQAKSTNVAAIGPMTARALAEAGVAVCVMPEEYSSLGLVRALSKFRRVILLRSAQGSPALIDGLREAGIEVEDVHVYEISGSGDPRLDDLIRAARSVHVYGFTSGSTSRYLIKRARELGLEESLREALADGIVVAIGPPTAAELKRLGVRVDAIPERFTFEDMLRTARDLLISRSGRRQE